jgi:hypothetical protein
MRVVGDRGRSGVDLVMPPCAAGHQVSGQKAACAATVAPAGRAPRAAALERLAVHPAGPGSAR